MKNTIKNLFIASLSFGLLTSCVKETYDVPVQDECVNPGLTKTKEVANLYTMSPSDGSTLVYSNLVNGVEVPEYVEAIVISSDEGGNFYKSMYLQPLDGSKGFNFSAEIVNAYTKKLQPGKKVFVKLNGLAYANPASYGRGLILGTPPTAQYAVDRVPELAFKNYIIPSCDIYNEDDIIHKITLAQATSSDTYLNTLVEIDDVQFVVDGGYYDPNRTDNFDSSVYITNGTGQLAVRTSRYANFAGYYTPSGRGKIRGVLTKYGTGSNPYQIILRTERDTRLMTNPRVDSATPIVGSNAGTFSGNFTETFESYNTSQTNFPNYINDPVIGSRYWETKIFSNNKYIQLTSFGSGSANKSYFFVPADLTAASNFSFKSNVGYWTGAVLKVYYILASDYTAGGILNASKLVDITPNFTLPSGPSTGYGTTFTSSGNYSIPASVTGNGYFVFEYAGDANSSPVLTTTIQIDNITVN